MKHGVNQLVKYPAELCRSVAVLQTCPQRLCVCVCVGGERRHEVQTKTQLKESIIKCFGPNESRVLKAFH